MKILVAGAGKIGSLLAQLLATRSNTRVILVDNHAEALAEISPSANLTTHNVDIAAKGALQTLLLEQDIDAIVSCLPYFCNAKLIEQAAAMGLHYFDLTEDVATAAMAKELGKDQQAAFVPRCGVAPGYTNLLAYTLMQNFESVDAVKLRAGCLPVNVSNSLQYALTWSIDGLINEYGNACEGIVEGQHTLLRPLQDVETIELDGVEYEAFNTSGGLGGLAELCAGKVDHLNYKTIRYPGHCDRMRFLMQDLYLNEDRDTLKRILLRALPRTEHDTMIIYVSVTGKIGNELHEKSVVKRIAPQSLYGQHWTAIQLATASAAAVVIDIVLTNPEQFHGFILQETLPLAQFMASPFATVYS